MDRITGRPDHIEDYLMRVREGQWFGWSDSKNKIYANLIVHDGGSKHQNQIAQQDLLRYRLHGMKRIKNIKYKGLLVLEQLLATSQSQIS